VSPSPIYRVRHETFYEYSAEVTDAYSVAELLPRVTDQQRVRQAEVVTAPPADELTERLDVFGNRVVEIGVHRPHRSFTVTAESTVEVSPWPALDDGPPWEAVADACASLAGREALEVGPMLARTPPVAASPQGLEEIARTAFEPGRPVLPALRALAQVIFAGFAFDPTATDVTTPLDQVLAQRGGVCQDFAHLAVAVCRHRGLAARYVSGYIETDPPPGEQRAIGADASHAWLSVWVPELGWIDLDPTNDQLPTARHVTVAWGRDYDDVTPVRGVVVGPSATQSMSVSVDVARV
jgi:transglutaminase-like putative cysteine protease